MKKLFLVILTILMLPISTLTACSSNNGGTSGNNNQDSKDIYISYPEIVSRMTDLKQLAYPAAEGEKCSESSAYNKLSRYNEETGYYQNWGQNGDEGYDAPRTDDGGYLVADLKGPGAIVRIWSADPKEGHIKIFIDDEDTPIIDMPFKDIFGRGEFPFDIKELCYDASKGKNCFVPISYNKSCKVILYGNWGMFYQVNYISFSEDTKVESLKFPLSKEQSDSLVNAGKILSECGEDNTFSDNSKTITIPAGSSVDIFNTTGSGAVKSIKIKPQVEKNGADWETLAEMCFSAYWDNEKIPSIWTTLGGFFGSITGLNDYISLPLGVTDGIMYSNWFMPYEEGAQIVISNDGDKDQTITYEIITEDLSQKEAAEMMRFHAKWNRAKDPEKDQKWPDSLFLDTKGTGRYVGTSLHIYKEKGVGDPMYQPDWWWGEGDEKFFVDGEAFPSWFGTGTEDYFGYAWGTWKTFSKPYHSQPFTNGGMFGIGNRLNNRFHIIDSVPFTESFEGFFEKYHRDSYSNWVFTNYWYLEKSSEDNYSAVSLDERTSYYRSPYPEASMFYEGEDLIIVESTGMLKAETQNMRVFPGDKWSNDSQMIFKGEHSGDYVKLRINVEEDSDYEIKICFTKANDFGKIQLYIDGEKLGDNIDLYDDKVCRTDEIILGKISLEKGFHEFTVKIAGKNQLSKGYFCGIDYLILQK